MPELTVVVLESDRFAAREPMPSAASRTIDSVLLSARAARAEVDVLPLGSGEQRDPPAGASTVRLFPLAEAYARNRALRLSRTPFVGYVRAGDVVDPGWVAAVLAAVVPTRVAIATGPVLPGERADAGDASFATALAARLVRGSRAPLNVAVQRERALEAGGFEGASWEPGDAGAEDLLLLARMLPLGLHGLWSPAMQVRRAGPGADGGSPRDRGPALGRALRRGGWPVGRPTLAALRSLPAREAMGVAAAAATAGARAGRAVSPTSPLKRLPAAIRREARGPIRALPASPAPKTHLMYEAGERRILHLYVDPSARLRSALADREAIRLSSLLAGIPALHAAVKETDAIWVVEDRLEGAVPSCAAPAAWFPVVAEWAVRLAQPAGPPVGETPGWRDVWTAFGAASPGRAERLREALEPACALTAVHMHGDLQRKNVLLGPSGVGVIDWEGAWRAGIPGLDLVFLALLARGDRPDPRVIEALARGRDPEFGPLRGYLRRAGVSRDAERSVLLAMLVTWTVGERRRSARSVRRSAGPFESMLDRFGDFLT